MIGSIEMGLAAVVVPTSPQNKRAEVVILANLWHWTVFTFHDRYSF
jgi:hypothetical protein